MKDYINNQHRYYTVDYYFKTKYQSKVFKVSLNGDFSCPNRDGTISTFGCTFCSEKGSGDFAGDKNDSLEIQFNKVRDIISLKWPNSKYIAYFQANTNTYAPLSKLTELYNEAISLDKDIVCLDIATRPDCLSNECLNLLSELNKKINVIVELGLQTIHDATAIYINRGYNLDCFNKAITELRKRNIEVIVHIINGLPNESKEMMLETAKYLSNQDIQGIKIHSLYLLENSIITKQYLNHEFEILSLNDYVDVVTEQLALLRDDIVIHRVNGDAPRDQLVEPKWSLKKLVVMNEIDKMMKNKNYYQGCKYKKLD